MLTILRKDNIDDNKKDNGRRESDDLFDIINFYYKTEFIRKADNF